MPESKLEAVHQVFIVQQLAMFERPQSVRDALKQNFDIEISLPGIIHYDISNPDLPKKWKTLFKSTRTKFLKNSSEIPIAQKSYRLKKLQTMFESEESNAPALQSKKRMQSLLEQAAKESGDAFTNEMKHRHTDPNGEALRPSKIIVEVVPSAIVTPKAADSTATEKHESDD